MSDDLVKHGYADGLYTCTCRKCGVQFLGEKRAWCCKGCAVSAARIEEIEAKLSEQEAILAKADALADALGAEALCSGKDVWEKLEAVEITDKALTAYRIARAAVSETHKLKGGDA